MQTPPYLKPGDTIGIVAPARKVTPKEIKEATGCLGSCLSVELGQNLFKKHHQYSGTDRDRASDLQAMLDDPGIRAIFCARGGYGCVRLLDRLDFKKFKKNPKWLIGFSDATVFHSHIFSNFGIETIHGPMAVQFQNMKSHPAPFVNLKKILFGKKIRYSVASHRLNRRGKTNGMLVGGNLSLLYALRGTPSDIATRNRILFIEDIDEYLYHIDRMMMNLQRGGLLKNLAGLIVGGMTGMKDNNTPFGKTAYRIIKDAVAEYDYPVCFNFPAGHSKNNNPLILGRKIKLKVGNSVSVAFL